MERIETGWYDDSADSVGASAPGSPFRFNVYVGFYDLDISIT